MRKERERRTLETAGMLFTLLFGNLLHFVYDWTGQAGWAAYLSAVNESTWEHMKLLAVPWLVWTVVTIAANRCAASALPRAIGLLAGLAAIPALFYTYTGILGKSVGVVNILIFQAAVLLAYFVSASLQKSARLSSVPFQILGILLHLLAALAFLFFTSFPPSLPLFVDPTNGCRFEPNVRTKAPRTAWIAAQAGVIVPEPGQDKQEPKQEPKQPAK